MKSAVKALLITAAALIIIGVIVFAAAFAKSGWNFGNLGSKNYETKVVDISDDFDNITVSADVEKVVLVPSADGSCRVEFYDDADVETIAKAEAGTLNIEVRHPKKWSLNLFSFSFESPKITVYLPRTEYAALTVETDTGDIEIPADFKFSNVDVEADTGKVECMADVSGAVRIKTDTGDILCRGSEVGSLEATVTTGRVQIESVACGGDITIGVNTGKTTIKDVTCGNFNSTGDTGSITLTNVIASGNMNIRRDTGDIRFEASDAAELTIDTDTGDVSGTLLTEKVFVVRSDTGRIDVPETTNGGKCKITTDTGDIKISIP